MFKTMFNSTINRPSSDAELFVSRTKFEFGPAQINKSTPVDSDVELNSPNLIQFEPKQIEMSAVFRPSYNKLCIRFGP